MVSFKNTIAALAAYATGAAARLYIHNYCGLDVTVLLSHNGSCDYGTTGACNTSPWVIGNGATTGLDWIADGAGTSVKVSKSGQSGILQFEYTMASGTYGGLYWDLSDLDGTPFYYDNVKLSPTGNGEGSGTCLKIRCYAGQTCLDAYQDPNDSKTRWCPADTGDMWLDLCQPYNEFITSVGDAQDAGAYTRRHHARQLIGQVENHS